MEIRSREDEQTSWLGNRVFLMNNVHEMRRLFESVGRGSRGSLTREQIKTSMKDAAEDGMAGGEHCCTDGAPGVGRHREPSGLRRDTQLFLPLRSIPPPTANSFIT
jgi:hypothetical protein